MRVFYAQSRSVLFLLAFFWLLRRLFFPLLVPFVGEHTSVFYTVAFVLCGPLDGLGGGPGGGDGGSLRDMSTMETEELLSSSTLAPLVRWKLGAIVGRLSFLRACCGEFCVYVG